MSAARTPRTGPAGRLLLESGPRAGTVYPVILKHTLVGRIDSAQLILDDLSVSRLHARLDIERDGVWIEDLDSREGTWVNGQAVRRARLAHGDRVAFGDAVVVFQSDD